jgi:hypothetical protein
MRIKVVTNKLFQLLLLGLVVVLFPDILLHEELISDASLTSQTIIFIGEISSVASE